MKQKMSRSSILFAFITLFSYGTGCSQHQEQPTFGQPAVVTKAGAANQKLGIVSQQNYQKIASLENKVATGGQLTESEADWLLTLSQENGTLEQRIKRQTYVGLVFDDGKRSSFPASRLNRIFDFAVQAINNKASSSTLTIRGCYILANLKDKRGMAYLQPLLKSENTNVAQAARLSIHILNNP